jgi:aspartokinase
MNRLLAVPDRPGICAHSPRLAVVKIGGSVLTGPGAFRVVAQALAGRLLDEPGIRLLVVVSAEQGATEALLSTAQALAPDPDGGALDLLWSTGELRSAALLTLALQSAGVQAAAANVHQAGLVAKAARTMVRPLRLRAMLAGHDAVVVPGFLARRDGDAVVSLGRGGSDLTAVLLASALGAERCELVKDVPGYFTADPHAVSSAAHVPSLAYEAALALADAGCQVVQRKALAAARDAGLVLVVRALGDPRATTISSSIQ